MRSSLLTVLVCGSLGLSTTGCIGRLIREGVGAVTGAAGKVVEIMEPSELAAYKGLRVDPLTVSPGLVVADDMPTLIRAQWVKAGEAFEELAAEGAPALVLRGEIIHYEMGGVVDQAIGPLQEVIVRTKMVDGRNGAVVGEANLIGRAKATTESGKERLAAGTAKAVKKWLAAHGLKTKKKQGEKENEKEAEAADSSAP